MGTRAIIKPLTRKDDAITTVYSQYDGYPAGLGASIAKILGKRQVVNGFNDEDTQINGMNDVAAFLVAKLKKSVGNIYIYDADVSMDDCGAEYEYHLWEEDGNMMMSWHDISGGASKRMNLTKGDTIDEDGIIVFADDLEDTAESR